MSTTTRRSFLQASAALLTGTAAMNETRSQEVIAGFDQTRTDYDKTQVWKPFLPGNSVLRRIQTRADNAICNMFHSESGLFHTTEGGLSRMMVCPAYGVYLEAGRVRGQIGGYDETYTGCDEGKRIVNKLGSSIRKYALPPGVSPGGHGGSHGYLSDDFVDAILRGRKPAVDVIDALNMTVPGYYAHLSALKDGETAKIPQYTL